MFNNYDITLFNLYDENGEQRYKRTYIRGVDWQSKQSVTVGDKGLLSADSIKIFIPYDADMDGGEFLKPKAFNRSNKSNYFTFKEGDIIVKGIIDFELTGVKPNTVKYLKEFYDDVATIISVIDCEVTGNWEVGAK